MNNTVAINSRDAAGVLIVGGSVAGLRTAERLRRLQHDGQITILEASSDLPYDRTALSKRVLEVGAAAKSVALRSREDLDRLGIDLQLGRRGSSLDPIRQVVRTDDGRDLRYTELVIATGADVRKLPGAASGTVHYLRTYADALRLRKSMHGARRAVVVGGGFIGSEVAAALTKRGTAVTLVEPVGDPLSRVLGVEVGGRLAAVHQAHGVRLLPGRAVVTVSDGGSESPYVVELDDGSRLGADLVAVGVGASPNVGWLDGAGVTVADGVVCDEYCRTMVPNVYAAGDVARWSNPLFDESMRVEHWTNAIEQAGAVGWNIMHPGQQRPYAPVPYVWSDQHGMRLQILGRPRPDDEWRIVEDDGERGPLVVLYGRGGVLSGAFTINAPERVVPLRRSLVARASFHQALEVVA